MKKTNNENLVNLLTEMEYLIGSECYNPNSYDGYQEIEGCSFRYPIMIPNEEGVYQKTKCNIGELAYRFKEPVTYESVQYMKYKFGSNELFIGQGLIKVLKFLEQRYNLDFDELEKSRR